MRGSNTDWSQGSQQNIMGNEVNNGDYQPQQTVSSISYQQPVNVNLQQENTKNENNFQQEAKDLSKTECVDLYRNTMPQEGVVRQPRVIPAEETVNKNPHVLTEENRRQVGTKQQNNTNMKQNVTNQPNSKKKSIGPVVFGSVSVTLLLVLIVVYILYSFGLLHIGKGYIKESEIPTTEEIEETGEIEEVEPELKEAVSEVEITTEVITTEEITTEAVTEAVTEDVTEAPNVNKIGSGVLGYVTIPEGYTNISGTDLPENIVESQQAVDVSNKNIITLISYKDATKEQIVGAVANELQSRGEFTTDENAVVGAYQATHYATQYEDTSVNIYIFTTDKDNYVHYLAVEYIPGGESLMNCISTFTY